MPERSLGFKIFIHLMALLVGIVILAPLVWLFIMSISSAEDLNSRPLHWWPERWDFSRYALLLDRTPNSTGASFLASLLNSTKVASLATFGALCVAIPAGYAASRAPRLQWTLGAIIFTYMLPPVALAVPLYLLLAKVGLLNSTLGLALVYLSILAPFTTWLMKSGLDPIPQDLEKAAAIDGARFDQMLRIVILPLALPIIATSTIFAFLLAWDEYFYALLFTSSQTSKTLSVAIADLAGGRVSDYGQIAAAGVLAALPPVAIGIVLQRALISGLTQGGVKG